MSARILVTGGLGYIGSHTVVALHAAGYTPVIVDNLSNSRLSVLERLAAVTGRQVSFHHLDLRDRSALDRVFAGGRFDAVIHFAALKAVGESVERPLEYWDNNLGATLALLGAMREAGVRRLVFSSSATVYGAPQRLPLTEDHPCAPANPYGDTKLAIERLLAGLAGAPERLDCATLRYFNPVGAHPSGMLGEDPLGVPNNLFPYVMQVAVGRRTELSVYGGDWDTADGTGVRDYVHVMDLAEGHAAALARLLGKPGGFTVNLGTGRGYSVLEVVRAFETASGRPVPFRIVGRRAGDITASWADTGLAERLLGWQARRTLEDMCRDGWAWQSANPAGYPA